jgi:superfamily I DNA/RNA helicase
MNALETDQAKRIAELIYTSPELRSNVTAGMYVGGHESVSRRAMTDDRNFEGVRLATMYRVKGLEFQYMFIVAANDRVIPLAAAIGDTDEVSKQASLISEKCLLYVALTRAQKAAYITSYGASSEFLPK